MRYKQEQKQTGVMDDSEYCKSLAQVSRRTGIKYQTVIRIKNILIEYYFAECDITPSELFHSGYNIGMFIDFNKNRKYNKIHRKIMEDLDG
jgi:hypothetical protein